MVSCTWKRSACSLKVSSVASSPTVELFYFFFAEVQEILEESNDVAAKDRGTTCFRSTSINNHSSVLLIYLRKKTSALTLLSSCLTCFPFTNLSFPLSFLSQRLLKPFLLPLFSVLSERWFS